MKKVTVISPMGMKASFGGDLWVERHGINSPVYDIRDKSLPRHSDGRDRLVATVPNTWIIIYDSTEEVPE